MIKQLTLSALLLVGTVVTAERWHAIQGQNNDLVQRIAALSTPSQIDIEGSDLLDTSRYRVVEQSVNESEQPQRVLWLALCDSVFAPCANANQQWRTFLRDSLPTESVEVWIVALTDSDVKTAIDVGGSMAGRPTRVLRALDDRTFGQSLGLPINRPLAVVLTDTGRVSLLIEGAPTSESLEDAVSRLRVRANEAAPLLRLHRTAEVHIPPDAYPLEAPPIP
jgi:hypothetical protein